MNSGGTVVAEPKVELRKSRRLHAPGGSVSHEVRVDGKWVGWVYDERQWRADGSGWAGRRWSVAWREQDDRLARWRSEGHRTRQDAVNALVAKVAEQ